MILVVAMVFSYGYGFKMFGNILKINIIIFYVLFLKTYNL
jgi:hypothetical protein